MYDLDVKGYFVVHIEKKYVEIRAVSKHAPGCDNFISITT